MKIDIKKLNEFATIPTAGSNDAAGVDLYASLEEPIYIYSHGIQMVGTGIAVAIPKGYFGAIFARSGLASKRGLKPANCVGVIDADYRGEIKVALYNDSEDGQWIAPGERIAQMVIMPYLPVEFNEVEELDSTERGDGGFGSTGSR